MKTKEELIDLVTKYLQNIPESDIEKIFSDVVKPDKNKEMSDFLFSMFFPTEMRNTGDHEFTFYKNKEWVFQQDYKSGRLWIRYSLIWSVFESKYGLNYTEIKNFINYWVETNTEWKGLTSIIRYSSPSCQVETNTECKGLTPQK